MSILAEKFRIERLSVKEAKQWLIERRDEGVNCPCCGQHVKVYYRQIHAEMAKVLVKMYKRQRLDPCYLPNIKQKSRDCTFLRYFGLIEQCADSVGNPRAGWWRVTERGEQFIYGEVTVPHYALIYNGKLLGYEGEEWSITDALGKYFDLDELLGRD